VVLKLGGSNRVVEWVGVEIRKLLGLGSLCVFECISDVVVEGASFRDCRDLGVV
jgi:hypothetical protein